MIRRDRSRNGSFNHFRQDIYRGLRQVLGGDTWRNTKIITSPQITVIASYFGLKNTRIAIADNIYLTILQKGENRIDRLSL